MTDMITAGTIAAQPESAAGRPEGGHGKTKQAASQFEALLLERLLRSAREAGGGMTEGTDQAGASMLELAEQQFAQVMAAQGGFGLAALVVKGLAAGNPAAAADKRATSPESTARV